jgi:hypothetical protein
MRINNKFFNDSEQKDVNNKRWVVDLGHDNNTLPNFKPTKHLITHKQFSNRNPIKKIGTYGMS